MNLAPDVQSILRRESARRHATMSALVEAAVRSVYGPKRRRPSPRRLVRENGYLVVAALPGETPITDARVREISDAGIKLATLDTRLATRWRDRAHVVR